MALSKGSRLGPYEILSRLGAGGMGEVYGARDGPGADRTVESQDARAPALDHRAVFPVEGGPSRPVRGFEPTDSPLRWASDGHNVFVASGTGQPPAPVDRVDMETGRREVWKEFVPADLVGIRNVIPTAISADGQTVLFSYHRTLSDLYVAEGLK